MEALLLNGLLVAAGIYFGARNIRLLRDDQALRDYVQTSPKAARWVSTHGVDRAVQMTRGTLPLGIAISAAMLAFGVWNLSRIYL